MKLLCKFAVGLVAVGIGTAVGAQELTGTLKKAKDTGSFSIGYRESSIPFSYLDQPDHVAKRIAKAQTLAYSANKPVALLLCRDLMWEDS